MAFIHQIIQDLRYYLLAVIGVAAAAGIRYAIDPIVGPTIPLLMFTVPVVVVALYGGFRPAIFATLLSAALSTYLFIEPYNSLLLKSTNGYIVVAVFLAIGVAISVFGERMKDLQASKEKQAKDLEYADRQKDEFLAMLAHELRNPLAGISAASELLKFVSKDPKQVLDINDVITRQVGHMTKLVDDLLDVSRVTRGLVLLEKNPLDINEAVRAAVEQTRPVIEAKDHHLTLRLPRESVFVAGDAVRLVQVITNILNNAAKYSRPGSHIDLSLQTSDDNVEIRIEDNGQGISPELLPRVFDMFVQAERTPDRSQGGLGIGLALVKTLVTLHGGKVTAASKGLDKGSVFTVHLPRLAQQGPVGAPIAHTMPDRSVNRQLHILIVDDNKDAAQMLARLLQTLGHTVSVEYDAKGALDLAHTEKLDVLVLDIGLPEMDGYELCRRLHRVPHLCNALFIALTGYGQESDQVRSRNAGFDHHLVKPADPTKLAALLTAVRSDSPSHH